jgi:hypothetical protein
MAGLYYSNGGDELYIWLPDCVHPYMYGEEPWHVRAWQAINDGRVHYMVGQSLEVTERLLAQYEAERAAKIAAWPKEQESDRSWLDDSTLGSADDKGFDWGW